MFPPNIHVFFQHPIWKSTPLTKTKWFSPLVHVGIFHIHRCQASALKPQSYGTWGTTGPKVPNAPWPCVRRTQCSWYNRALELDRIEKNPNCLHLPKWSSSTSVSWISLIVDITWCHPQVDCSREFYVFFWRGDSMIRVGQFMFCFLPGTNGV